MRQSENYADCELFAVKMYVRSLYSFDNYPECFCCAYCGICGGLCPDLRKRALQNLKKIRIPSHMQKFNSRSIKTILQAGGIVC